MARSRPDLSARLTPGMARVLDRLAELEAIEDEEDAQAAEIACDGLACWVGMTRTNHATVDRLLALTLVADVSDEGGIRRYRLSEAGRACRRRPELVAEIAAALTGTRSFTILGDRLAPLPGEPPLTDPAPARPG